MKKVDRLLGLVESAETPDDLAGRAARAAFAGEPIIAAPSFWQRLVPLAAPAAIAVAAALLLLWLRAPGGDAAGAGATLEEAGVADILAAGDVGPAVIDSVLVLEDL